MYACMRVMCIVNECLLCIYVLYVGRAHVCVVCMFCSCVMLVRVMYVHRLCVSVRYVVYVVYVCILLV